MAAIPSPAFPALDTVHGELEAPFIQGTATAGRLHFVCLTLQFALYVFLRRTLRHSQQHLSDRSQDVICDISSSSFSSCVPVHVLSPCRRSFRGALRGLSQWSTTMLNKGKTLSPSLLDGPVQAPLRRP